MAVQVDGLLADDGEVVDPLDGVRRELLPGAIDPRPHLDELSEVDLGVEVGGEVPTMSTRVHIEDVDGVDGVEVLLGRQRAVRVDHSGVESGAEDGSDAGLGAPLPPLPLVVGVPRWVFANDLGVFVDGSVDVGGPGLQARLQHGHVHERRTEVDHDLRAGLSNQRRRGLDIHRVELAGVQPLGRVGQMFLPSDALDDGVALRHGP